MRGFLVYHLQEAFKLRGIAHHGIARIDDTYEFYRNFCHFGAHPESAT